VISPWRNGPLLGFDLETTGVDRFNDVPVSSAFVRFDGGEVTKVDSTIVNPGRPIPHGAIDVHGITDEQAAEGEALDVAIAGIVEVLLAASRDLVPVVGSNLAYDLTMVDVTAKREIGMGLVEAGFTGPVIDVLVIDKTYAKWRKGKRTLDLLCEHNGVVLDGAHDASVDAIAAVQVAIAQPATYRAAKDKWSKKDLPDLDKVSPQTLHDLQIVWHHDWAVDFSGWRVGKGMEALAPDELLWPVATRV